MMEGISDTICAPASGRGGAIAVIRMSGEDCIKIADSIFTSRNGRTLSESGGYTLHFGEILELDEAIVAVYRAPHSYTGEDSVEISCHASSYIVERILARLIDAGARMAGPGEFTRRAFLNGKMDLAQAEAVADVIAASSEASLKLARNQLKGGYSSSLRSLRDELLELSVLLELELDFSEEEVEFADRGRLISLTEDSLSKVSSLKSSFRTGNAIKNGIPVAIAGAPNSGKSTLLNALLGENRAIVSDMAGTTRDTVEETMTIDGIQYRFIDTAGIRSTSDSIEMQGVERSIDAMRKADVVIWLRSAEEIASELTAKIKSDGAAETSPDSASEIASGFAAEVTQKNTKEVPSDPADNDCESTLQSALSALEAGQIVLEVWNKADLVTGGQNAPGTAENESLSDDNTDSIILKGNVRSVMPEGAIAISALKGTGLDELKRRISESQKDRIEEAGSTIVTNLRHYEALGSAHESLTSLLCGLRSGIPTDLVAEDLRSAIATLGSIWGEGGITSTETLARLFERHCIGK